MLSLSHFLYAMEIISLAINLPVANFLIVIIFSVVIAIANEVAIDEG